MTPPDPALGLRWSRFPLAEASVVSDAHLNGRGRGVVVGRPVMR
jgi:hypothetical protein